MTDALSAPPPQTELDILFAKDVLELTREDISDIIAYQRKMRARKASGEVMAKITPDLSTILGTLKLKATPKVEVKRRF